MTRNLLSFTTLLLGSVVRLSHAVSTEDGYYKGDTIRMVVAFSAGGGYDPYTRPIARDLAKHIPGCPRELDSENILTILSCNNMHAGGFL